MWKTTLNECAGVGVRIDVRVRTSKNSFLHETFKKTGKNARNQPFQYCGN